MDDAEYLALREKVDAFAEKASASAELTCHAGCSGCCRVQLEICDVEAQALTEAIRALPEPRRAELRARPASESCALLGDDGRCAAYGARPLVCRTQGLALRYPRDTVPIEAIMGRAGAAEVTWCPLNYTLEPPLPDDVLDAERVDVMLALVNRRAVGEADALRRRAIRDVVEEATR